MVLKNQDDMAMSGKTSRGYDLLALVSVIEGSLATTRNRISTGQRRRHGKSRVKPACRGTTGLSQIPASMAVMTSFY